MDSAHDIPDSTDWLSTPLKGFADLENALHCQICKEFYETPMTTSCSHTFCSRCIRTSLTADGKCPACRANDQASKLRNNWALQEVVATFLVARPAAISVARKEQQEKQAAQTRRPGKRKRILDSDDVEQAAADVRTTRSKSRRLAASQTSETEPIEIDDADEDGDFEPEEQPQDGLVECPLGCGKRMKIEQVEPHLDRCEDEQKQENRAKSRTPVNGYNSPRNASLQSSKPQERLAQLNYSMMRDTAMRKKFEELGIPSWGVKQLLIRRHTEWVNLWNANCDSSLPRTKRELLHDLDTWERTQGGKAPNANGTVVHSVMRKDFDGGAWANKNKDDFSRLIADARRKKSNPTIASNPSDNGDPVKDTTDAPEDDPEERDRISDIPLPIDPPDSAQPYADNPEAMASIRRKVKAISAGEDIEPVMNAGFESNAIESATQHAPDHNDRLNGYADPQPGAQNPALLDQNHFGSQRKASGNEHAAHEKTGMACDLPAHLRSSPRKMPMFTVPEQPVTDLDGDGPAVQ